MNRGNPLPPPPAAPNGKQGFGVGSLKGSRNCKPTLGTGAVDGARRRGRRESSDISKARGIREEGARSRHVCHSHVWVPRRASWAQGRDLSTERGPRNLRPAG
mmetsp:Transcript_75780/g.202910  ORF Transcript_75780/g.202910 Transcript_75780/m.202910 type:complete len:103 (+) Transcript_75780:3163-3471(+)